jgi:hypothetical protein
MPQELNAELDADEIRDLLVAPAKKDNVVVIVPSKLAAQPWQGVADQILLADNVVDGIAKLQQQHVGLTVLVNRYDGIDLPDDACRVLAIIGLPEVTSCTEYMDMAVLSDSQAGLRRQMQRVEQGMGRGVRSNDDYCVVLLMGAKLTARVKSPEGTGLLTPATQAQLDLSRKVAKELADVDLQGTKEVIDQCLNRDPDWIKVSKKALLKAKAHPGLAIDPKSVALRTASTAQERAITNRQWRYYGRLRMRPATMTKRHGSCRSVRRLSTISAPLSLRTFYWLLTASIQTFFDPWRVWPIRSSPHMPSRKPPLFKSFTKRASSKRLIDSFM